MFKRRDASERGQVLIIVAGALVVIIAMVGLVVDGGYAWGQQRMTQNASDAASEAGAIQLARNLAGVSPAATDADILAAVNASGTANGIGDPTACYTDFNGHPLTTSGGQAPSASSCSGAALVGGGTIPSGTMGVRAEGSRTFPTFLMRVIGFSQMTSTATATARTGWSAGTCSAEAGCTVLPIAAPSTQVTCSSTNALVTTTNDYQWAPPAPLYIIPMCGNSPGNVGWLDWTPTAGGTSELINAITTPSNPAMYWPNWYYVTSTGNVNSSGVQDALRTYDGQIVGLPLFDATCNATPTGPNVGNCPAGHLGGTGSNQWYHIYSVASFRFCSDAELDCVAAGADHGAYISGNNTTPCSTGNGATSCLAGHFAKEILGSGEVTAAPPPNCDTTAANYDPSKCLSSVSVQLIH